MPLSKNSAFVSRTYRTPNFEVPWHHPIEYELILCTEGSGMSIPACCSYFKKCTKKTYINFLNEVRIGYACRMLTNTGNPINHICFDSGFQSLQNFNKQFYKLKQVTPSDYRKRIRNCKKVSRKANRGSIKNPFVRTKFA